MKDFLKNRRKKLQLTQKEMANKMKLKGDRGDNVIHQWEIGKRLPSVTVLLDLKEAYEMTDAELLQWLKFINQNKKENN